MESNFKLLLTDKKEGVTSFSSLGEIKRLYRGEKVGHAGTLDKFASGLMLVMVGNATRLNPVFSSFDKRYRAKIEFGSETSTLDSEGEVCASSSYIPSLAEIESILPSFLGEQDQVPPLYSALHVDGKRAYEYAQKGKDIDLSPRRIKIYSLDLISYESNILEVDMRVSKGTYIRSFGRDLALRLGTRGHLIALRREEIGPFSLSDLSLSTRELLDKTELLSSVVMDEKHRKEIDNGVSLRRWIVSDSDESRPYCFVSLGKKEYGIGEKGDKFRFIARY